MAEPLYYAELKLTGDTKYQIEDLIWIKKQGRSIGDGKEYVGIGRYPQTMLDVNGQIRLNTGITYNEGEIRYKNNLLWVNTGGI